MSAIREQKKKATQKAILKAAVRLFGENGFENTSIEQIAKVAGIGKGTIYSYFSTKRDILYAFCEGELEYIHEQLASKTNQDSPILEQMLTIFMAEYHYITENPDFGRLFMQEMIFPNPAFLTDSHDENKGYFAMIFPIIIRAQKRGEIRPKIEPLHVCGHFFALFILLLHGSYTKMISPEDAESTLRTLFTQILDGLQPSLKSEDAQRQYYE